MTLLNGIYLVCVFILKEYNPKTNVETVIDVFEENVLTSVMMIYLKNIGEGRTISGGKICQKQR